MFSVVYLLAFVALAAHNEFVCGWPCRITDSSGILWHRLGHWASVYAHDYWACIISAVVCGAWLVKQRLAPDIAR